MRQKNKHNNVINEHLKKIGIAQTRLAKRAGYEF